MNTSASNEEVVQRLRAETAAMRPYLRNMREDLLPARFSAMPASNVFDGMFSAQALKEMRQPTADPGQVPPGEAVARQVGHLRYLAELNRRGVSARPARALREGTWLLPENLHGMEEAVGIVA